MPPTPNTIKAYRRIVDSKVFRIDGPDIDLPAAFIELADAIDAADDDGAWVYLGEGETNAADLIVAAYWALAHWHSGQWSDEYEALCSLGRIFEPGRTSEPNEDDSSWTAYQAIEEYFRARA